MQQRLHALLALTCLAAILFSAVQAGTITDVGETRRYQENFDVLPTGSTPTDSWYAVTSAGSGTNDVLATGIPSGMSGKVWRITENSAPYAAQISNTGMGVDLCQNAQSIQFDGFLPDLSQGSLTSTWEYRVQVGAVSTGGGPANSVGVRVSGIALSTLNNFQLFVRGNTGAEVSTTPVSLASGTTFNALIAQGNCSPSAAFTFTVTGLNGGNPQTLQTSGIPLVGDLDELAVVNTAGSAGQSAYLDNYDWQGAPLPQVTLASVSPNSGTTSGGTSVTLTGTNFLSGASVAFGGSAATSVVVASPTTITATTPAHAAGAVTVTVTNPDGQSASLVNGYTYAQNPVPIVSSLTPSSGPIQGGTVVNVTGQNFVSGAVVRFGSANAIATTFVSGSLLQATSPPASQPATVSVTVTNPDGQSGAKADAFTYFTGSGPGGTQPGRTTVAASGFDDSGKVPGMFVRGDLVVVSHGVGSNFALAVSISRDAGATWTTAATGNLQARSSYPVSDADGDNLVVVYSGILSGDGLGFYITRSTDGGLTWSTGARFDTCGGTTNSGASGGAMANGARFVRLFSCRNQERTWSSYSDDGGATWSTPALVEVSGVGTGFRFTRIANRMASETEWEVFIGHDHSAPDSLQAFLSRCITTNSGTAYACSTINDPVSPVAEMGVLAKPALDDRNGRLVAAQTFSSNLLHPGFRQPSGQYYFLQAGLGVPLTYAPQAASTDTEYAVALATSGSSNLFDLWTTTDGVSYTDESFQAGTPLTTELAMQAYCSGFLLAYQDPTTTRLTVVKYERATSCTPDILIASRSVNNLKGFDVGASNEGVITREARPGGGQLIHSYDPSDLSDISGGGFEEEDCDREDGVASLQGDGGRRTYLTFANCDESGFVNRLHIRNQRMDAPEQTETICAGEDFCDIDIQTGDGGAAICGTNDPLPGGLRDLGRLEAIRWDWTTSTTQGFVGADEALLSWAFTDPPAGLVGIYSQNQVNNNPDCSEVHSREFTGGTTIDDFCSWRSVELGEIADYVGAVRAGGQTKIYRVTDTTVNRGPGGGGFDPDFRIEPAVRGDTRIDNGIGLGCGRDRALVLTSSGGVQYIRVEPFAILHTFPSVANPLQGGAALSDDGFTGAIAAGSTISLLNHSSNTVAGTIAMPAGTLVRMVLDANGQNLWVATSSTLSRYDISAIAGTAGIPLGAIRDDNGNLTGECKDGRGQRSPGCNWVGDPDLNDFSNPEPTTAPTPGASFLGQDLNQVALDSDVPLLFLQVFIAVCLILGLAFAGFQVSESPGIGALSGAGGLALSFSLSVLPIWMGILMALIAIAVVVVLGIRR